MNSTYMGTPGRPRDILVDTAAKGDAAATVSIASISEQDWYISRTHGVYHIPACAKGQPYALLMITARGDALDLGDNRRFPFTYGAADCRRPAAGFAGSRDFYLRRRAAEQGGTRPGDGIA